MPIGVAATQPESSSQRLFSILIRPGVNVPVAETLSQDVEQIEKKLLSPFSSIIFSQARTHWPSSMIVWRVILPPELVICFEWLKGNKIVPSVSLICPS